MKTGFIIAEYDPFHNGHKYHIQKTREAGADAVAVIMSGNFVQRGTAAVNEKHERAAAALSSGADLVLELPVKYALSSADKFALGGVLTADATKLGGFLSFGAPAEKEALLKLYEIKKGISPDEISLYSAKAGCSYPAAMEKLFAVHGADENDISLFRDANAVLALEYMSALEKTDVTKDFISVKRLGTAHGGLSPSGDFASASFIRSYAGDTEELRRYMPEYSFTTFSDKENGIDKDKLSLCLCSLAANKSAADFALCDNVGEGLENRLYEAVRNTCNIEDAALFVKSKRFTLAKIRRILVGSALGIERDDYLSGVNYIRVLGANETGRTLLREIKNKAEIPVVSNLSELTGNSASAGIKKEALRDAKLDFIAGKIYDLCRVKPRGGNPEYEIPPVML